MSLENPKQYTEKEVEKIKKTRSRVDKLGENFVYDLVKKEDAYRNKLYKKNITNADVNELANDFSTESLETMEEKKKRMGVEEKVKEAEEEARVDFLTGLGNRRAMEEYVLGSFAAVQRVGGVSSMVLMDIDNFKNINDTLGHQAGDRILSAIAKIAKNTLHRQSDKIYRVGGEEFLIVLPTTRKEGSMEIAEKIRKNIEDAVIEISSKGRKKIKVTVSLGCADTSLTKRKIISETVDEVISQADQAMYQSKNGGKNKVTIYQK
ncbi:MAG: GGDEF domain-containing protein [bacterium]|nr:GGDEF domain-containing protein [bacterium]